MQFAWLFDWWANIKVELYIDPETYELLGKENAVVISNHRSDIDWLVEFILAQRAGCLGNTLALAKKPLFYILILEWSMWFAGFIVIEGNWAKDERKLQATNEINAELSFAKDVAERRRMQSKTLSQLYSRYPSIAEACYTT
ncbi:1-acyl-sn-glycerol-3-phosphate acyltransferase 3-like [Ipomoea triloba]|uniref:1-acyl-sn-glycerol-3-phosphate acyltransferase 3-like n=1 Tax=Ipomoea triloba TaxID=35885 RepID=UPI00125E73A3|nr:1-acyl-sn-glycerol-3-phosphate acyltransferase 3-like [Ipomoea triloba]